MNPRITHPRSPTASSGVRSLTRAFVLGLSLVAGLTVAQTTKPQPIGGPKPVTQPVTQPVKPVTPPAPKPVVTPPAPKPTAPKPVVTPPAAPKPVVPPPAPKPAAPKPAAPKPTTTPPAPNPAAPKPAAAQPGGKPIVTPRTNPKVQDGGTLAGPAGFGGDGFSSAALPLVAVGKQVGWRIDPDDFRVFVPQAAAGRSVALEVFSPDVNRNDYANQRDRRTYYGDELYGKTAKLTTNFSFKTANGQVLANRSFGESLKHTYERLYQANLEPGFYPFTALADGNGKNSFAIRVTNGARVEASQFTVTARGQFNQDQIVGFVQIDPSLLGKTVKLENYDADGTKEIVLTLVAPDGKRYPLTASPDTQWATNAFVVNQSLVGTWKILARILPTTRQFSNSFAVRLRVDDKPLYAQVPGFGIKTQPVLPLKCDVVDTTGAAIPGAGCAVTGDTTRTLTPILPACYTPVSATILEGQGSVVSTTQVNITSPSGSVRFVADCPKARVQVNAVALVCGQRTPLNNASFSIGSQTARAPATMLLEPGEVTVTPVTLSGSTAQPVTVTATRGQTAEVTLEYTVATSLNLTPSNLNLIVGQTATLTATASTAFPNAVPATINVTLPAGLEATGPVKLSGVISNGKPLTLSVPVRAKAAISNANVRASLEPNCGVQALSSVTVTQPVTPPPPSPAPAILTLTKTVDRELVKPGDKPVFTVTVKNTGGSTATGVRLTDTLPAGLTGDKVNQSFDLPAGESRSVRVPATVTDDATGVIVNTARVDWNNAPLTATAQVRVQPVIDLSITKVVNPTSVKIGDAATYTIVVTNNGPSAASGVTLSDPIPEGLTYVSNTATQGTATFAAPTLSANLGSIARGGSATVTVRVTTTREGRFTNTATTRATETETNLENNRASAILEVSALPPEPQGSLVVSAFAVTCGARTALQSAAFTLDGQRVTAPATLNLKPGTYTLQPEAIPGSSAQPVTVTVAANQSSSVELLYAVDVKLSLTPEIVKIAAGGNATLVATATTAFPYAVPTTINLVIPEGFDPSGTRTQTGTVSNGKPLTLSVPVRALKSIPSATASATLEPNCNVSASSAIGVTPSPLPEQRRESQVVLLAKVTELPVKGNALILSDRIPAGASYIAGSSRLLDAPSFDVNTPATAAGTPISDPYVSADRLFWVLPLKEGATTLSKAQALNLAAQRGQIVMRKNAQGQTVYGITYRLAHTGALVMPADRVAVIAAVPTSRPANAQRPTAINPNSPLGQLIGAGDLFVLQGDPSILEALAKAVPFTASSGSTASAPRPQGGSATTLRVRVERGTTDSIDQPVIVVEAFDKDGLPASDEFATLEANVDIVDPDAAPSLTGYQVRLVNGVGRARVQNLSGGIAGSNPNPITEVRVEARLTNEAGTITSSTNYRVNEASSSVGAPNPLQPTINPTGVVERPVVAIGTATVGGAFDFSSGNFSLDGGLRFALRGNIAPGLNLTLGINWQATFIPTFGLSGTLNPAPNPYERFPVLGDSSDLGSDIRSQEGFYAKLEFGTSYALYGDFNPGFKGVLSGYNVNYTGFQTLLRGDGYSLNAFATDAPLANQRFVRQADGSDLYFLGGNINPSSERVVVVTYQLPFGAVITGNPCVAGERIKLRDQFLNRNADYTIDYATGIVRLRQAVTSQDPNGNIQCVEIDYATVTPTRDFRAGAQATIGSESGFSFSATALQFRNGAFGGNSSLLFGTGLRYSAAGFDVGLEGAYSGIFGAGDYALAGNLAYTGNGFGVRLNYQNRGIGFVNPETNTVQSGQVLNAAFLLGDPNGFRLTANGAYTQSYTSVGNPANIAVSAEARNNFGGFTAGLGLAYQQNLSTGSNALFGTAGLEANLGFATLSALQRVPVIGGKTDYGDTTVTVTVPLSAAFSLRLADKLIYEWNGIRQQISFGVSGSFTNTELIRTLTGNEALVPEAFGQTNVTADYQLDTVNGNTGRARLGVDTTIPLSDTLSLQLAGESILSPNPSEPLGSASAGLRYKDSGLEAALRAQLAFLPTGLKQVYTAQLITQVSPEFVISPALEYAVDPSAWNTPGAKFADGGYFSIAFAYRGANWSALSNNTGKFGLYSATGDKVEGEIQFGYQSSERLYLRSGFAYRLLFGGTFTTQFTAGLQYFLTDGFAVGAQGALQLQPATGFVGYAFGLEGGLRVVDNLLFTVGFNFVGLSNSLSGSFNPGVYFRLDWKIDERTFGWR